MYRTGHACWSDTSSPRRAAEDPDAAAAKMGSAGYVFERFVMLTYFVYIFWQALKNPKNYSFLTFWTLLLHVLYFSIDKASPVAGAATRLLHGMSFVAAVAVLAAYSQIAVAGSLYWGSFYDWNLQIGLAIGVSVEPDLWMYLRKAYEHIWPVLALLIDARLNRAELQRCYRGCSRAFRTALALGGYLALGVTWEQTCQSKDSGADFFAHYALPPWFASARLLAPLGIDATGLAPDAVFSNGQKVIMLLVAAVAQWRIAGSLITKAKKS